MTDKLDHSDLGGLGDFFFKDEWSEPVTAGKITEFIANEKLWAFKRELGFC